ncbi:hypothetical protein HanXRQr2_Chr11g0491801 [Helianthus annuus]|uniref:Uncharacterized protein n=1 Tax=Helianthus annuus TaxID=4232 RepID=A0A9K3N065_HELAN|nr:hypothetical protein HanXRQr2_Chr11g0491801 [Helianthus annuus]KAJ0875246.1 hypothetical protein HanPSC8_Chr11g0473931 [Helianthus annuus]
MNTYIFLTNKHEALPIHPYNQSLLHFSHWTCESYNLTQIDGSKLSALVNKRYKVCLRI